MVLEQIITIIVVVLVLVFVWGIVKKLFKIMFYAGLIIFLLISANLFFIFQDFNDFRQNFGVSEKKVILKDEDRVLTGLVLDEDTNLMTNTQLNDYSSYLTTDDFDKILGDSYKLLIFDIDIISNLDNEIDFENGITTDEAITILNTGSSEEKATVFSIILADEILSSRNPLFFLSEFKEGNIMIYPETALFKAARIIPLTFIKETAKSILIKAKDKVETLVIEVKK